MDIAPKVLSGYDAKAHSWESLRRLLAELESRCEHYQKVIEEKDSTILRLKGEIYDVTESLRNIYTDE